MKYMHGRICVDYMEILPFYRRGLNMHRFWYSKGFLEPIPCRLQGTIYLILWKKIQNNSCSLLCKRIKIYMACICQKRGISWLVASKSFSHWNKKYPLQVTVEAFSSQYLNLPLKAHLSGFPHGPYPLSANENLMSSSQSRVWNHLALLT